MFRRFFRHRAVRRVGQGASVGLVGGVGGTAYMVKTDEAWQRSATFWKEVVPILTHYKYVEYKIKFDKTLSEEAKSARYAPLHVKYADDVLRIILELRGYYVKVGQVSAQFPDLVPKEWISKLRTLEDDVPPEKFERVRSIVEADLGKPLDEVFTKFAEKPLGAASIGQAHRATLKDGREVVVKVKYPNAERLFQTDMDTILTFCKITDPRNVDAFKEAKKQFMLEFDYEKEAQSQTSVRDALKKGYEPFRRKKVYVPEVYHEYTTNNVLVMEYIEGDKLINAVMKRFETLAAQQGKSLDDMRNEFNDKEKSDDESQQSSSSSSRKGFGGGSGPSPLAISALHAALWTRDFAWNCAATFLNFTVGFVFWALGHPSHSIIPYKKSVLPFNSRGLARTLVDAHGFEMFVGGTFNTDPHAGNVLLMPGERLALIDYGQVKTLSEEDRSLIARLIIAIADKNSADIVKHYTAMGFRTKHMRPETIEEAAILYYGYPEIWEKGHKAARDHYHRLMTEDPPEATPERFVMCGRTAMILKGVASALGCGDTSLAQRWRPFAEEFLLDYEKRNGQLQLA